MNGISIRDAGSRFVGVLLLVAVAYLHLLDISHKVDEGIWYMVFLFSVLILGCAALSLALVRLEPEQVRLAWVGSVLIAGGALFGYAASRIVPLPGMADHQGDWISLYGVLAAIAELGLIIAAAWAMRDLTLNRIAHRPPLALRMPFAASVNMVLLLALLPQQAFAHGGEDEAGDAGGSVAQSGGGSAGKGADSAGNAAVPAVHGDPFLGTVELGVALLASLGFIWWAGRALAARAEPSRTSRLPG